MINERNQIERTHIKKRLPKAYFPGIWRTKPMKMTRKERVPFDKCRQSNLISSDNNSSDEVVLDIINNNVKLGFFRQKSNVRAIFV